MILLSLFTAGYIYQLPLAHADFVSDGKLYIAAPSGLSGNSSTEERIELRRRNRPHLRLESLSDLSGHCSIRTNAQALLFVRLRTSPSTFSCFPGYPELWLEPFQESELPNSILYCPVIPAMEDLKNNSDRYNSIVSHLGSKYRRAIVRQLHNGGFEVHRLIEAFKPFAPGSRGNILKVVEQVTPRGSYSVVSEKQVPLAPTDTSVLGYQNIRIVGSWRFVGKR